MALKSVYHPGLPSLPRAAERSDSIRISGDEHRHLVVARAALGESIEIFDGLGAVWTADIELVGKKETLARVVERRLVPRDPVELILGLALVRASAFEFALEKAVEIGVARIIPFIASRSNGTGTGRSERWAKIAVEAAKQSKRFHLPAIEAPVPFDRILSLYAAANDAKTKILFAERGGGPLMPALSGSPAIYLIGPEGGWTDAELDLARQNGFALVGLGSGILKTETAAIVGGALLRYELARYGPET